MEITRCVWAANSSKLMQEYHDNQWGVIVKEDAMLFEMLVLESFQAGLSWAIILNKREGFREAFDNFDYHKIALYNEAKIEALMHHDGIVKNRLKIKATISNARIFMELQKEYGSFSNYLWSYTNHEVFFNHNLPFPVRNELSDTIASDLKKRGVKFFGTVIVYSYLQAVGVINDHDPQCFKCINKLQRKEIDNIKIKRVR